MGRIRKAEKSSLKGSFMRLTVFCWVLPVAILTLLLVAMVARSMDAQALNNAESLVSAAVAVSSDNLDAMVSGAKYISYNSTVKDAYAQFLRDGDYEVLYRRIDTFLIGNYKFDEKYMFTYFRFLEDDSLSQKNFYAYNESLFPVSREETGASAIRLFLQRDLDFATEFSKTLGTSIGFLNREGNFYLVRNLYLGGSMPAAMLVMRLNTAEWLETLRHTPWISSAALTIQGVEFVLHGAPVDFPALLGQLAEAGQTAGIVLHQGQPIFCGSVKTNDLTFSYAVSADNSILLREVHYLYVIMLALGLLSVLLLFVVLRYFQRNVNRPIQVLFEGAKRLQAGEFGYQILASPHSRDFTLLTENFNIMSSKLKSQFELIYREELALRDAKIMALQSQINPHFLGNTLEIINWEVRLGQSARAGSMIEALSTMLDAAMDRTGKPTIRLSEEMMYVDAYLLIIGQRFGKRMTVKKEIDVTLLDIHVPRLILQPIIENAVEYGINRRQQGTITIRVYKDAQLLVLEIENDGALSPQDHEKIRTLLNLETDPQDSHSAHLGIRNVHERLHIIYGQASGLSINMTNRYTVLSKIIIPIH